MVQKNAEVIDGLDEKFVALTVKKVDSKNRITLGEKILKMVSIQSGTREFQIFYGDDGDILLRPVVSIHSKEAWIYRNPKVIKTIRKGLQEAKEGRLKNVQDLQAFLEDL